MKQNTILKAALAIALGAVAADAAATPTASSLPRTFAAPMFAAGGVSIAIAPVAYTNDKPLAASTTYYVYVQLTNGATFNTAAGAVSSLQLTINSPTGALLSSTTAAAGTTLVGTPVISTDGTFAYWPVTTAASTPVQTNSTFSYTAAATAVFPASGFAVGSSISAMMSIGGTGSATTLYSDVDGQAGGVVANAGAPLTATVTASSSFAAGSTFTGLIDAVGQQGLGVTTSASYPSTTLIDFGSLSVTNVATVMETNGTTAYKFDNAGNDLTASTLNFALTGSFASYVGSTNKVWLDISTTCAHATFVPATKVTSTAVTFTNVANNGATGASGVIGYVCASTDTKTLIQPTTPSVTGAVLTFTDKLSSTPFNVAATGNLYALNYNGGVAATPIYIPTASNSLGQVYVRLINTGYTAAVAKVQVIDDATGSLLGTAGNITSATIPAGSNSAGISIPAEGAIILSTKDIENVVGTFKTNTMPRLLFTAPTNLAVQTYVLTSQGAFSELDPVTGLTR